LAADCSAARRLRPRKVSDFKNVRDMRAYLIQSLTDFTEQTHAGIIADFSPDRFSPASAFVRLGGGSIGGKARGLAFISAVLKRYNARDRFENVRIAVPNCAAIGTDVFDAFMDENGLRQLVVQDSDDETIARAFLAAPPEADGTHLRAQVACPDA
jgi:hypothetical protein